MWVQDANEWQSGGASPDRLSWLATTAQDGARLFFDILLASQREQLVFRPTPKHTRARVFLFLLGIGHAACPASTSKKGG